MSNGLDNNVITAMVIRPLDDHTYCARSAFNHLGALAKAVRLFIAKLRGQLMCSQTCADDIVIDLQPVCCHLRLFDNLAVREVRGRDGRG